MCRPSTLESQLTLFDCHLDSNAVSDLDVPGEFLPEENRIGPTGFGILDTDLIFGHVPNRSRNRVFSKRLFIVYSHAVQERQCKVYTSIY